MKNKLGAFIVPTGIGANIGGYAGDASVYARKFAQKSSLIVNPNVVNAGGFSGITENMLYVEGYSLDSFFKGEINLIPSTNNKIGIIYDKAIPKDVLNIHINTQNAVQTVYGINIHKYTITEEEVGVEFYINSSGISVGSVKNIETIEKACESLITDGCDAIAIVCLFEDSNEDNEYYSQGEGVDPVGGVEAIISHDISMKFKVPCAHSPAFEDFSIYSEIVNPKSASEYITPTFLPCILLGLSQAPKLTTDLNSGINVNDLNYLIMPYDSLGSIPVFEALKRNIKIYSVRENYTQLNVTKEKIFKNSNIVEIESYEKLLSCGIFSN
ncbi:DUF3326 domain-containing protein [bacterium]|nr:DUF3326 domain-containing protein [bacterium]